MHNVARGVITIRNAFVYGTEDLPQDDQSPAPDRVIVTFHQDSCVLHSYAEHTRTGLKSMYGICTYSWD